jgi:two-component system chemotaxis response regulator CheB
VPPPSHELQVENAISRNATGSAGNGAPNGMAAFSCPDCQGVLTEVDPETGRYRCRVGHSWSAEALLAAQGSSLDHALWTALRTLDEKVALTSRMRDQARVNGQRRLIQRYERMAEEATDAAEVLRKYLTSMPILDATETEL